MGYIRHHAIIVTGSYDDWAQQARRVADGIFPIVSPLFTSSVNGYETFFIPPDGSKEGWDGSDAGDARRDEFILWLESVRYEDGSSPLQWAEVAYYDDNDEPGIERSSAVPECEAE